jgi:hypothetical protein
MASFPGMFDPNATYPEISFPSGGIGDPVNQNGSSDHFPIGVQVVET